jgi:hypothetical protein
MKPTPALEKLTRIIKRILPAAYSGDIGNRIIH